MAVLSLSRQFGTGDWTLGKSIADRLNYQFVSDGVIDKIAKDAMVASLVKNMEEIAKNRCDEQ
ncbi:cytidylate kinase family protein [Thermodesulfobacteriota bacterium]